MIKFVLGPIKEGSKGICTPIHFGLEAAELRWVVKSHSLLPAEHSIHPWRCLMRSAMRDEEPEAAAMCRDLLNVEQAKAMPLKERHGCQERKI